MAAFYFKRFNKRLNPFGKLILSNFRLHSKKCEYNETIFWTSDDDFLDELGLRSKCY